MKILLIFTTSQIVYFRHKFQYVISDKNCRSRGRNQFVEIEILFPSAADSLKKEYKAKPAHKSTTEEVIAIFTIVRSFIIFAVYRLSAKIIISTKKTKLLLNISPEIKEGFPIRRMPGEYSPGVSVPPLHASPYHDSCV